MTQFCPDSPPSVKFHTFFFSSETFPYSYNICFLKLSFLCIEPFIFISFYFLDYDTPALQFLFSIFKMT